MKDPVKHRWHGSPLPGFSPRGRPRDSALAVLLVVTAKVFLYDLSTLTSIYRVASFIALGLLLLGAGFAYGKLRPVGAE